MHRDIRGHRRHRLPSGTPTQVYIPPKFSPLTTRHIFAASALAALSLTQFSVTAEAQTLVISEVMAANLGEALDPSYNFGGWVEFYNPGDHAVALDGLTLADAKGHRTRLTKGHGEVPPQGYRCVWFGHCDADFPTQLDWKLDCDGGTLTLLSPTGTPLDAVTYPPATAHTSWALTPDGGWLPSAWPTAEKANAGWTTSTERLAPPRFNRTGGWVESDEMVDLVIEVPAGAALHYTLDGTMPTRTSQRLTPDATGHVRLAAGAGTIIRTRAIAMDAEAMDAPLPSAVVTHSFLGRDAQQLVPGYWDDNWHGGGWGNGWGGWVDDHYEDVRLEGCDALSVVTDPRYLYDDWMGIYVDGLNGGWSWWTTANYFRNWDRPVNAELISAAGETLFNLEADMAIAGAYSRMNEHKSFKIKADRKYEGQNFLPMTDLLPDHPFARHSDVLVRVGGTDIISRHKDNLLQAIVRHSGMRANTQAFRPVHVFLNGRYEETLLMRDVTNRLYGATHFGHDTDTMDALEESDITNLTVASGTLTAFEELCRLATRAATDDAAWEEVQRRLDVEEWANYFALQAYLGNGDWPQNNIKVFRDGGADWDDCAARFHVVLQDLDACFHLPSSQSMFDRFENDQFYPYAKVGYQENRLLTLFLNLMNREEFRRRYVDAFSLVAGSVMRPDHVEEVLAALRDELAPGYVGLTDDLDTAIGEIRNNLSDQLRERRLDQIRRWKRAGVAALGSVPAKVMTNAPQASAITLNGQPIPRGDFDGELFLPARLEATSHPGQTFECWRLDGEIFSSDPAISVKRSGTYEACFVPTPVPEAPPYPDALNTGGVAPIVVNEVSASGHLYISPRLKRSDWIELYNTTPLPQDIAGYSLSDDPLNPHKWTIPDGITIEPYGHTVIWADGHEAPFKLANRDQQAVILTAPDNSWHSILVYDAHGDGQSVGRWPDGATATYRMDRPTISQPNRPTAYDRLIRITDPIILSIAAPATDAPTASDDHSPNDHAAPAYDLSGRRITTLRQGIGIVDGRKVAR